MKHHNRDIPHEKDCICIGRQPRIKRAVHEEELYQVSSFPNVSQFNQVVVNRLPDIFLLDVMLPDGNGVEVCEDLKSSTRTSHIPIILMSANTSIADIKDVCRAEDFIAKPFDINDFIRKVNRYVN